MHLKKRNEANLAEIIAGRMVVVYGMGYIGGLVAEWCEQNRVEYVFADRSADGKRSTTNKQVLFPEEISICYPDGILVIASINYFEEIRHNLIELGFREEQMISCLEFLRKNMTWEELENTVNWENVRKRAEIFSRWITPEAKIVADYGHEKNYLKEFLAEGVIYESPNYITIEGNALIADFEQSGAIAEADVAFGMAILMSFKNPEVVINHVCFHTKKAIIFSYVPMDLMGEITFRRAINYHNDYTEKGLIKEFEKRGFFLMKKEQDPFDSVNIIYMFEKKVNSGVPIFLCERRKS